MNVVECDVADSDNCDRRRLYRFVRAWFLALLLVRDFVDMNDRNCVRELNVLDDDGRGFVHKSFDLVCSLYLQVGSIEKIEKKFSKIPIESRVHTPQN